MKKILVLAATIVGLVTIFEVGLLLFPWTYSPHLVSRPLTLAEKNQRLWERFAPVPLWVTEAAKSQDTETEDLVGRVARLETRIAQLERQVASQNPVLPG